MPKVYYDGNSGLKSCELSDWAVRHGYGLCEGRMTYEHILPRQMFRGNREGFKLAYDVYGDLFGGCTCMKHNSGNKCADTEKAILFLLRKRLEEHPELMELAIKEVAATFKSPPPYLRLDYLLD